MTQDTEHQWPREVWLAELDDDHNGTGMVVLSEHATVARFEGNTERERAFQKYVDADIHDSAERYWKCRLEVLTRVLEKLDDVPGITVAEHVSEDPSLARHLPNAARIVAKSETAP